MNTTPRYIAMWSGPRNISTALMRSFSNRSDCFVSDEPLYAHYLKVTGFKHPGREITLEKEETDWRKVVAYLTGPIPRGKTVWYQKHMAHHLLPDIGFDWLDQLSNCFLIREPLEMLTSLIEFIEVPTIFDTGLPQQWEIFQRVRQRTGKIPPVIEGRDVQDHPPVMLEKICQAVGIEYTDAMLHWPPGLRDTDGPWAPYWYSKVEKTTSFGPFKPKNIKLPVELEPLLPECNRLYEQLREFKIGP